MQTVYTWALAGHTVARLNPLDNRQSTNPGKRHDKTKLEVEEPTLPIQLDCGHKLFKEASAGSGIDEWRASY